MNAVMQPSTQVLTKHGDPLTGGQNQVYQEIMNFLVDPNAKVHVIAGYSGTGKSTTVETIIRALPSIRSMLEVVGSPMADWPHMMTASTNKAAENLSMITGMDACTIHSAIRVRPQIYYDNKQRKSRLISTQAGIALENVVLWIDEFSPITPDLLSWITRKTHNCKIIYIGDPRQLIDFKAYDCCVAKAKFPTSTLSEVVRTGQNQILDLSVMFREAVDSQEMFPFEPDEKTVFHVEQDEFEQLAYDDFSRPDWKNTDSRILCYTNAMVIDYNKEMRSRLKGSEQLAVGDYVVVNTFVPTNTGSLSTDQSVLITDMQPENRNGLDGYIYELDKSHKVFMPNSREEKRDLIKRLRKQNDIGALEHVENKWADLRAEYACTINKSQGSTYKTAFIDLNSLKRAKSNTSKLARLLYVAVSRASDKVILTGDI